MDSHEYTNCAVSARGNRDATLTEATASHESRLLVGVRSGTVRGDRRHHDGGAAEFTTSSEFRRPTGTTRLAYLEGIVVDSNRQTINCLSMSLTRTNRFRRLSGPMGNDVRRADSRCERYYNGGVVEAESLSIRAHEGEHAAGHNNSSEYDATKYDLRTYLCERDGVRDLTAYGSVKRNGQTARK